ETIIYPATYQGAHNVCATPDGETIFVGDEIGSGPWTRAFDVSDLSDPEFLTSIIVDENAPVHNCYVEGDLLHIAHYTEGYQVFDVSTPASPEQVAFYDTFPQAGSGFNGAWTAYPYLPSGRTIISDLQGGLFVVRADVGIGLSASAVGSLTVAPGGAVSFDYTVTNNSGAATTGDLFFTAKRNGVVVSQGVVTSGTLPAGQSVSGAYTQQIPATAPAGTYTYELNVGRAPSNKANTSAFPLLISGQSVAAAEAAAWTVAEATPWSAAPAAPEAASATALVTDLTAFPNPFTDLTTLRFGLDAPATAHLAVYDVLGREVAVLIDGVLEAGGHEAVFDARGLPSGAYAYRLNVGGAVQSGSITLLR
ncbi:MAG: T9SS type A sorting domain-containing protein, partial [Bacteroidota bacterium]